MRETDNSNATDTAELLYAKSRKKFHAAIALNFATMAAITLGIGLESLSVVVVSITTGCSAMVIATMAGKDLKTMEELGFTVKNGQVIKSPKSPENEVAHNIDKEHIDKLKELQSNVPSKVRSTDYSRQKW